MGAEATILTDALTSLFKVKRHLRLTATTHDAVLVEYINAASKFIKRHCGRDFTATDYYEWLSGKGQEQTVLKNWPIIRVHRIACGSQDALSVSYSGSDIEATIEVGTSSLYLRSLNAAGETTSNSLSFTSYPTASTLVTAIAAVSGWSATTLKDTRAQYLHPTGGRAVKESGSSYTVRLTYAYDSASEWRVDDNGVVARVSSNNQWYLDSYRDGFGYGGYRNTLTPPTGYRNLLVHYRAGYETIPADVDVVCREVVQGMYQRATVNLNMQSESLGDYSYSLADQVGLAAHQIEMLRPYTREAVA